MRYTEQLMMFHKAPVILQKLVFPRAWLAAGVFGLFAITWGFSSSSAHAAGATYHVNNQHANCNDAYSTSQNAATSPWCTIAAANQKHSAGDTVLIYPGTYRETMSPKAGVSNAQRTVYSGSTGNAADVKIVGSDVVTGWQQYSGNIYRASFQAGNQCRYSGGSTFTVQNTNCWVDGATWLKRGAQNNAGDALADLNAPGEYFYDQQSDHVYVWMPQSDNPSSHLIECSKRKGFEGGGQYTAVPEVNNFTLQHLTITQTNGRTISFNSNPGRPGNITIQHTELSYSTGDGYCAGNPAAIYHGNSDDYSPDIPNVQILNNSIHDIGSDRGGINDTEIGNVHAGAGIEFYTVKDSLIQGNVIYNTFGPIGMKRGNTNITIRNNTIYNSGEGIWIGPPNLNGTTNTATTATVEGNVIYNIQKEGHQAAFYTNLGNTWVHFYNNTLVNMSGIRIGTDNNSDSSYRKDNVRIDFRNNIISELWSEYEMQDLRYLTFRWNSLSTSTSNNNLFHTSAHAAKNLGGAWTGGTYGSYLASTLYPTLLSWQQGTSKDTQSVMGDPRFVNASNAQFALQAGSPAIDKGALIPGFHCNQSDDVNPTQTGCRHWKGAAPDIGAFEYGIATTSSTPSSTSQAVATTPDPNGTFVVAVDGGASPAVRVITGGRFQREFFAFQKSFRGGMSLAFGDLGTDGQKEIVVGTGVGPAGEVRVFSQAGVRLAAFLPYGKAFRNGVNVALADVNGDGTKEIITVPMRGDQRVRTFGFRNGRYTQVQAQFNSGFLSTSIAAGDLNGDGRDDIAVMSETNGSPTLLVYTLRGTRYQRIATLRGAFSTRHRTGYSLAIADVNRDGTQEIVATRSSVTEPEVRTFTLHGSSFRQQSVFTALGKTARGGGRISVMDYNGDGAADILLTRNIAADPKVYIYSMLGGVRRIGTVQAFPANQRFVLVSAGK